jgi:hypothetical protein
MPAEPQQPPDSRRVAEAKADAILAEIPDADFAVFADVAVGLLLSAARRRRSHPSAGRAGPGGGVTWPDDKH